MRLFVRVAEAMSFSGAARAMDISVGVASRQVASLEQYLQTPLLRRTTRRVTLTQAGESYLKHCRTILSSVDEAEAEARATSAKPAGILRVHAPPAIGRYYLLPAIGRYREACPDVQVSLTVGNSPPQMPAAEFDVSIVTVHALPDSSFVGVRLAHTCSVLCVAPRYMKRHPEILAPSELGNHSFVSIEPALTASIELPLLGPNGYVPARARADICVNSTESAVSALELGMGIGTLPLAAAFEPIRNGRLMRVLPHYTLHDVNVFAIFPSAHFLDAKIRTWLDLLKIHFLEIAKQEKALLATALLPAAPKPAQVSHMQPFPVQTGWPDALATRHALLASNP